MEIIYAFLEMYKNFIIENCVQNLTSYPMCNEKSVLYLLSCMEEVNSIDALEEVLL